MTHDASAWLNGRACPAWRQSSVLAEMARDGKSFRFWLPSLSAAPAECVDAALRGREPLKRWVLCNTDWAAALTVATKAALALRVAGTAVLLPQAAVASTNVAVVSSTLAVAGTALLVRTVVYFGRAGRAFLAAPARLGGRRKFSL